MTFSDGYIYDNIFESINPSITITTVNTDFKNTVNALDSDLNIQ